MKYFFLLIAFCWMADTLSAQTQMEKLLKHFVDQKIISSAEADSILQGDALSQSQRDSLLVGADNKFPAVKNTEPLPKLEKIRDIFTSPYAKLGGFAQFFFHASDQNLNPAAAEPVKNEFLVRQAVLWVEGRIIKNFNYMIALDLSTRNMDELYGEWVPADFFNARFGQFKVPFTIENPSAIVRLESAGYTRSVAALAGINGDVIGKQTGRDYGFQVSGNLFKRDKHFLLQYWGGMFQGTGTNIRDNNSTKDFAGTLVFQPVFGLRLGASMYAGQAFYMKPGDTQAASHVRNRRSMGFEYQSPLPLYFRSEWINANDGGIDKEALYGTVTWRIVPEKWDVFAKVDYFNTDKSVDAIVTEYVTGINYWFARLNRIQLNYVFSDYSTTYMQPDANKVVVQMQLFF